MHRFTSLLVISILVLLAVGLMSSPPKDIEIAPAPAPDPPSTQRAQIDSSVTYESSAKNILDKRCVVCHGCYDAPCQLKLGSVEGVLRGAHSDPVYNGERLTAATPTRLFEDASSVAEWRELDFFSVTHPDANLIVALLEQKRQFPLPDTEKLPTTIPLDINRTLRCPTGQTYEEYLTDNPLWGMPYGLPAISDAEHQTITTWLSQGEQSPQILNLTASEEQKIKIWETFFNKDSLKGRLVARYLYEHLFLAHLYFEELGSGRPNRFFKLIRSKSPPGEAPEIIVTRRPFDEPSVDRVFYRLVPLRETVVDKLHMPFALSEQRKTKWTDWFYSGEYEVTSLPSYNPSQASNPFITFAQLPSKARYKFMLDESQYSIMQFIKGAVCRGQIALNVINDHFWVVFADPDLELPEYDEAFMEKARSTIVLPAEAQSNASPTNWLKYAKRERNYLKLKSEYIKNHVESKLPITTDLLWDGGQENDNVALTIFRHFDAASVVKGLVGDQPQTAWIITYPLFERIHYLLVAGYDVYGNMGHQLNSRMYMDFLRMEGEYNFLALLPNEDRKSVREKWYRGSVSPVEEYVYSGNQYQPESDITYLTSDPLTELYAKLKNHVKGAESQRHLMNDSSNRLIANSIAALHSLQGKPAELMPQASIMLLTDENGDNEVYTLLSHNAYSNISHMFGEMERRLPQEDTMTFAPGVMTSHPNALFSVNISELEEFTTDISTLNNEQDYAALMTRWGVRRTHPAFWQFSDLLHDTYRQDFPIEFGYFDYNRLENR